MRILALIAARFRAVEIPFASWEMVIIRFAFAWLVYCNLPGWVPFEQQTHPNGLAQWMDFTFLANPQLYPILWWGAVISLSTYVLGFVPAVGLTYLSVLFIAFGTLENSQGAIEHYLQLLVMVLLGQALVAWWLTVRSCRRGGSFWIPIDVEAERKLVHWARIIIAGAYLAMAITKLDRSKGRWIWDTPNISVQIIKTHSNELANSGVAPDPFFLETLPQWIAGYPWLSRIFFSPGLWLEFLLFLGLMGRGWSLALGLGVIALHRGISLIMGLNFASHEWLLWVFYVNLPFWIWLAATRIRHSFRVKS
jgi:hypothetical protein